MRLLTILIAVFCVSLAYSQTSPVLQNFAGKFEVIAATTLSPQNYRITIANFYDVRGYFSADDIAIGDVIYANDGNACVKMVVTNAGTTNGTMKQNMEVQELGTFTSYCPMGIAAIMREVGGYPLYVPNVSESLRACINSYAFAKVGQDAPNVTEEIHQNKNGAILNIGSILPNNPRKYRVERNGIAIKLGIDFSISGDEITFF